MYNADSVGSANILSIITSSLIFGINWKNTAMLYMISSIIFLAMANVSVVFPNSMGS